MAYAIENDLLGQIKIGSVDTVQAFQLGTIVGAVDITLGGGEFVYLIASGTIALGNVVQYDQFTPTAVAWTGTANSSRPLAVAMSAMVTGQYGWFQVSGVVAATINGTVAAGAAAFYQANGVVSSTAVAGKQVLPMIAVTANGVPAAGLAYYQTSRMHSQGQIT